MENTIGNLIDSRIEQRDYNTALRLKWLSIADLEEDFKEKTLVIIIESTKYGEGCFKIEDVSWTK